MTGLQPEKRKRKYTQDSSSLIIQMKRNIIVQFDNAINCVQSTHRLSFMCINEVRSKNCKISQILYQVSVGANSKRTTGPNSRQVP